MKTSFWHHHSISASLLLSLSLVMATFHIGSIVVIYNWCRNTYTIINHIISSCICFLESKFWSFFCWVPLGQTKLKKRSKRSRIPATD